MTVRCQLHLLVCSSKVPALQVQVCPFVKCLFWLLVAVRCQLRDSKVSASRCPTCSMKRSSSCRKSRLLSSLSSTQSVCLFHPSSKVRGSATQGSANRDSANEGSANRDSASAGSANTPLVFWYTTLWYAKFWYATFWYAKFWYSCVSYTLKLV